MNLLAPPLLCLGTAQLGLNYGITNKIGKLKETDAKKIIMKAVSEGIKFFDTAQDYGRSEELLGDTLSSFRDSKIINKFSYKSNKTWSTFDTKNWERNFQHSLLKLKATSIDSFLVHNCRDLNRKDSRFLIQWLDSLKERSLVRRIGVSIYNPKEIDFLPLEKLDIIQLPLSIFDQRFLDNGIINHLVSLNISVHVRSIFLQGLILQKPENLPNFLSPDFKLHHHMFYDSLKKSCQTPLEASLDFIYRCKGIEAILFGVTNLSELISIIKTWNSVQYSNVEVLDHDDSFWAWNKTNETDPRTWP